MRGLSTMYRLACEEEQTCLNSGLVAFFRQLDTAESLAEACPRHVDLSHNVLGDAGAAAFFRTLAVMRWVETVDARHTGAGPRAVAALCDTTICTDSCLMAPAGSMPPRGSHAAESRDDQGDATPADICDTHTLVAPVPSLRALDLRGNPIFQLTGKVLLRCLEHRERVVAAFKAAHPTATADFPGLLIEVDLQNLQPTLAKKLLQCKAAAIRQNARRERRRVVAAQLEWLRLFCVPSSVSAVSGDDNDGTASAVSRTSLLDGLPRPVGAHAVYRIPDHVPESLLAAVGPAWQAGTDDDGDHEGSWSGGDSSDVASVPATLLAGHATSAFYDLRDPLLRAVVYRWNDYMDAYLLAHRSFIAAGAGPSAAAQLCVELGADALSRLMPTSTNAFVWTRHAERREARRLAIAATENARRSDIDRLDPLELWLAVQDSLREEDDKGAASRESHLVNTEELLTHVGKLLRTFYACPSLEASLLDRDTFILPSYLARLRTWYYQTGTDMLSASRCGPPATNNNNNNGIIAGSHPPDSASTDVTPPLGELSVEREDDIKLLYYRVVSSLVSAPLTSLSESVAEYFTATEARLGEIRRVLIDSFGTGAMPVSSDTAMLAVCGALPVLSARAQYVLSNDAVAARAWSDAYDVRPVRSSPTAARRGLRLCTCGAAYLAATARHGLTGAADDTEGPLLRPVHLTIDAPLRRPCAACCHHALAGLSQFLASSPTRARLETLALTPPPVSAQPNGDNDDNGVRGVADEARRQAASLYWMPCEFRAFVADMVWRQASVRRGGCAFVPNMLGRTGSIHSPYYPIRNNSATETTSEAVSGGVLGLVELLAELKGDVERLKDVVSAFEEWYRLQALEGFDITRTAGVATS